MNKKQGRRNLRHARIGQQSDRKALTLDSMKSRLLCLEFQLSEDEEPVEIFFRPIPTSRVMELQGLTGKTAIATMLSIVSEYVVDPQTGNPLASPQDWDAFGVDGIQAIVSAMVDGARGGKSRDTGAGPTMSAVENDAMVQAALEVMQGDPDIAEAFKKASAVILDQEKQTQTTEVQMIQEVQTEATTTTSEPEPEATAESTETEVEAITIPMSASNGTSAETPLSDSPSNSTAT